MCRTDCQDQRLPSDSVPKVSHLLHGAPFLLPAAHHCHRFLLFLHQTIVQCSLPRRLSHPAVAPCISCRLWNQRCWIAVLPRPCLCNRWLSSKLSWSCRSSVSAAENPGNPWAIFQKAFQGILSMFGNSAWFYGVTGFIDHIPHLPWYSLMLVKCQRGLPLSLSTY